MNKTVNINLSGIFFHIDEDAFHKLQHYLDSVKRSFANTPGSEEINADIEARIAELFQERMKTEKQVISLREVEEIIMIMGQPEDYVLDEEIFEDETAASAGPKTRKQLFRDTEHSYVAGVSSGLGHYLGMEAIWVRILWVLLTLGSSGAFILIYIAFWIFVPEAKTTADKLAMRGEPVTISNIERKIKEGFDEVSGKMKNIDYEKYGYKARSGAGSAATAIGKTINVLLGIFVKFIGILILLIAGTMLIGLFIGLFTIGTFGVIDAPWTDYIEMVGTGGNLIWIISLLSFFAIGIPFFFLFILGLKILVENLKSIGRTSKLVLLGLWIISVLGLIFFGIKQATETAFEGEVITTKELPVSPGDTLYLSTNSDLRYNTYFSGGDFQVRYNENDEKVIFSDDIRLVLRSTRDSLGRIEIVKTAQGSSYEEAYKRAGKIIYNTSFSNNELVIDQYLTTDPENKYREQEVRVVVYLPKGTILKVSEEIRSIGYYNDILEDGEEGHFLMINENGTECLDCPEENFEDPWEDSDSQWDPQETDSIGKNGAIQPTNDNDTLIQN